VFWPVPEPLAAILAEMPDHAATTLLTNSEGHPWTESGFRASWRQHRLKLEAAGLIGPGLTLYDLRHTVATILREMGHEPRSIADALGQKTTAMAEHYSRRADRKPKMVGVVKDFSAEVNRRRTKTVKPEG
jgi:integrase